MKTGEYYLKQTIEIAEEDFQLIDLQETYSPVIDTATTKRLQDPKSFQQVFIYQTHKIIPACCGVLL
jgi:hypothetical protein